MPLYEYLCDTCGERFEVMQKFSDAPLSTHEKCGGNVHRLLSPPALQFKGSGWYINDYAKSGGKKETTASDSSAKTDTATKTDTSTPAAPATTSKSTESKPSTS
jgi:putative FmdB family regulatory protein